MGNWQGLIPFTIRIVLLLTCHLVTSSRAPSYTHPSQTSAMGRAMLALMKIGLTTQKYGKTLQPSCHDMDLALPKSLQWMPCLWSVGIPRKIIQLICPFPTCCSHLFNIRLWDPWVFPWKYHKPLQLLDQDDFQTSSDAKCSFIFHNLERINNKNITQTKNIQVLQFRKFLNIPKS